MSWNLISNMEKRLEGETVLLRPAAGGSLRVALGYPNTYSVGMSNLGLQVVYAILNSTPGVSCERFFLPEQDEIAEYRRCGRRLFTCESQRPVSDFDVVAFSLSYEHDYVNLALALDLAGLPLFSSERGEQTPFVLVGGAITLLNPEPVADLVDAFCIGEAEGVLTEFVKVMLAATNERPRLSRAELYHRLSRIPSIYVPSLYTPHYESKEERCLVFSGIESEAGELTRNYLGAQDFCQTCSSSQLLTADTELGRTGLVELSRGCLYKCRFCTVGFSHPPIRWKPLDKVWSAIEGLLPYTNRIGLISGTAGDYPQIEELCRRLMERKLSVSFSSLRVTGLPECLLQALVQGGARTLTLAPEVGSDGLRRVTNKSFTDAQYLATVERVFRAGVRNIRMYAMLGLPGERNEHLDSLVQLAKATRQLQMDCGQGVGRITLSVGQFIPKPVTPFQWEPLAQRKVVSARMKYLENQLSRLGGVTFSCESPKWALIQGLLARGDRRMARVIAKVYLEQSFSHWQQAFKEQGIDVAREAGPRDLEAPLPWEHLGEVWSKQRLIKDRALAYRTIEQLCV